MSKAARKVRDSRAQQKGSQAESDLRTLIEAQKIMQDKDRMAAAMAMHGEVKGNLDAAPDGMVPPAAGPGLQRVAPAQPTANLGAF
jgi:hypothetical protein